jgi:hypothetical protein
MLGLIYSMKDWRVGKMKRARQAGDKVLVNASEVARLSRPYEGVVSRKFQGRRDWDKSGYNEATFRCVCDEGDNQAVWYTGQLV